MTIRMQPSKYYVYTHAVGGEVFYVGKGRCQRAYEDARRSARWHAVVADAGYYDVEILAWYDSDQAAREAEAVEIRLRRPRANLIWNGMQRTLTARLLTSLHLKGRVKSLEERAKISAALCGRVGSRTGTKWSLEQRARFAATKPGKPIRDLGTGVEYPTAHAAARALGMHKSSICGVLKGRNKTAHGRRFAYVLPAVVAG